MRRINKIFFNAILAGIAIAMAGTVFLATSTPLLGAFLFSFGLLFIVNYDFKLYTGAIGYLATKNRAEVGSYLIDLIVIWLGNFVGCNLVALAIRNSRTSNIVLEKAELLARVKIEDNCLSILILSFFCGILMYIAVETYAKKEKYDIVLRILMLIFAVVVFILSGFEHCVANMYYFGMAQKFSMTDIGMLLLMTLGNSLGGMFVPFMNKFRY